MRTLIGGFGFLLIWCAWGPTVVWHIETHQEIRHADMRSVRIAEFRGIAPRWPLFGEAADVATPFGRLVMTFRIWPQLTWQPPNRVEVVRALSSADKPQKDLRP